MKIKRWIIWGVVGLLVVCMVLAGILVLSNRNLPTQSTVTDRLSEEEKGRLAEFLHLRRQLGVAVWQDWETADIPLIVYNESYAFLIGYPNPPEGWVKVPQNELRGQAWEPVSDDSFGDEPYYRQPLPGTGETPQAFAVRVGDRWVASMPTLEWMKIRLTDQFREDLPEFLKPIFPYRMVTGLFLRGSDGYISLFAHESFHAYQGLTAPERLTAAETTVSLSGAKYPWTETAFQSAWQTELDLLAEAVQAETEAEMIDLAQQFVAQRTQWRQEVGLNKVLIDFERQREWVEGPARYVELEIWPQASVQETYEPLSAVSADPDFDGYATIDRRWAQEVDQMRRMADDEGDGRFYYSGMAQSVLLDRLMLDWKSRALDGEIFLDELLATAVAAHTVEQILTGTNLPETYPET